MTAKKDPRLLCVGANGTIDSRSNGALFCLWNHWDNGPIYLHAKQLGFRPTLAA
jgi:hypothetical protein